MSRRPSCACGLARRELVSCLMGFLLSASSGKPAFLPGRKSFLGSHFSQEPYHTRYRHYGGLFYVTGLGDTHIAGKTSFLGLSVNVFLEEISIQNCRQNKDYHHQRGWSPSPLRDQVKQNGGGKTDLLSAPKLGYPSSLALGHQCCLFPDLQTWTGTTGSTGVHTFGLDHTPLAFLGF